MADLSRANLSCPSCNRNLYFDARSRKLICPMGHEWSEKQARLRQREGRFLDVDRNEEAG